LTDLCHFCLLNLQLSWHTGSMQHYFVVVFFGGGWWGGVGGAELWIELRVSLLLGRPTYFEFLSVLFFPSCARTYVLFTTTISVPSKLVNKP
jgi:hypothetical protein